jgi:hypothetical protein
MGDNDNDIDIDNDNDNDFFDLSDRGFKVVVEVAAVDTGKRLRLYLYDLTYDLVC